MRPVKTAPPSSARRQPRRRTVRIDDVAKAAGVSTATVSRTLTLPDMVQEETRRRVMSAVEALGYTPNAAARRLRGGKARTVLIIAPSRRSLPFHSEVLRGMDVALGEAGFTAITASLEAGEAGRGSLVDLTHSGFIDGVLTLTGLVPNDEHRSAAGIPAVAACTGSGDPELPSVVVDDSQACATQVRHLVSLGHRRLAYLAGPDGNYNEIHRFAGFKDAVAQAGLASDVAIRLPGSYSFMSGGEQAAMFLDLVPRPTGVVVASDEQAIAFMKVVRQAGLTIPGDLSVIGFDGIELGDFVEPTLTTVRQPRFEIGATAARLLIALMDEGRRAPPVTELRGELVLRGSTGPAPL